MDVGKLKVKSVKSNKLISDFGVQKKLAERLDKESKVDVENL